MSALPNSSDIDLHGYRARIVIHDAEIAHRALVRYGPRHLSGAALHAHGIQ
jgi:hypothetical protein